MATLVPGSAGVPPSFPPTHFAKRLPASALLWLVERGCPHSMGAHSGAAGLDRRSPPASDAKTSTHLSSLRRPIALDRHPHPWTSMMPNPMLCHYYPRPSIGVGLKACENASA